MQYYPTKYYFLQVLIAYISICDPICQNESSVAYLNIGVIKISRTYTKIPLKWYITELCRVFNSENIVFFSREWLLKFKKAICALLENTTQL